MFAVWRALTRGRPSSEYVNTSRHGVGWSSTAVDYYNPRVVRSSASCASCVGQNNWRLVPWSPYKCPPFLPCFLPQVGLYGGGDPTKYTGPEDARRGFPAYILKKYPQDEARNFPPARQPEPHRARARSPAPALCANDDDAVHVLPAHRDHAERVAGGHGHLLLRVRLSRVQRDPRAKKRQPPPPHFRLT